MTLELMLMDYGKRLTPEKIKRAMMMYEKTE